MTFHIITLFPDVFDKYLNESILGNAIKKKLLTVKFYNIRDFSKDKHKSVDNSAYGGGPGMVLGIEPLVCAVESALKGTSPKKTKIILFSASGRQFDNKYAKRLAGKYKDIVLIAGRYEGVDERLRKIFKCEEVSVGPYVLTGGELPSMILIDAVSRQISGVLGKKKSLEEMRYGVGVPVYTRPEIFKYKGKKYRVPKVLLSGNHKKIADWREKHKK